MNQIFSPLPTAVLSSIDDQPMVSIGAFNELLRGEIAATETYGHAAETWEGSEANTLRACQRSHEGRMILLRRRIESLGGHAVQDSGLWGMVARSAERAAFINGPQAVLRALWEGEDHVLEIQQSEISVLDEESYELVRDVLHPQQQETLALVRALLPVEHHA